jgi:hypothetical protein
MSKISKDALIAEAVRCGKDPNYFITTYGRIQHPVKGLIPFRLYPYQEDIVRGFVQHRKNIILKARQLGITTVTAAYIAWLILFHRDKNVLIVATKQETSKNMIRIIRNIFKYMPKWMMEVGRIKIDNRHSIELENGSRVKAVTTSSDVGRSEAVSMLVVDEVAHIKNFDEIWTGLWPTVSTGGCIALFSTPNGTGNEFHKIFEQARNYENQFNCRFGTYVNPQNPSEVYNDRLMWWVHPEHDQAWFQAETNGKSVREIAQEYLCNFNASGDTFIFHEDIARIEKSTIRPPIRTFQTDRNIWIWEEPQVAGNYLISCDVSRGDAQDYSAFHVIRLDSYPLQQVCEYKGKIRPDQLGILLVAISQFYNNAMIAPENNSGWSGQTIMKIQEAGYPYLFYSRRGRSRERDHMPVDPYYAQDRGDFLAGYSVTSGNRLEMLSKMEQYVRMGDIVIHSTRTLEEFKTFIVNDANRPEAMRGYSDDLVMALAGGMWVRDEAFLYTYKTDELAKAMIGSMSTSRTKTTSYSDFNFKKDFMDRGRIEQYMNDTNKIKLGTGEEIDLNWLITSG